MKAGWIIGALVLVGVAAGVVVLRKPRTAAAEYRTSVVDRGTVISSVSATGTVKPVTMVQVGSQVSGTIQLLHADFNSSVRKGQVVAQLDPSVFRTQLAQFEAGYTRAEVNVADADRTLKRTKDLLSRNLVSQSEVDAAQAALDRSQAELKQARASVDQARVNLDHTTITSPIDGVVVARNVDVGQTVAASLQAPVLFEIANDLTDMQVEASIDEADIGRIQVGQAVHFTVDAFPDDQFAGVVAQIRLQPITVQNVVTYTTVIAVKNPDLKLRPGMTANVSVEVARRENVLRVPSGALTFRPPDRPGMKGKGGGSGAPGATMAAGLPAGGGNRGGAPGMAGPGGKRGERGGRGADSSAAGGTATGGSATGAMGRGPGKGAGAGLSTLYVKAAVGEPRPVRVRAGITDGYYTEVAGDELHEGDQVVVGVAGGARPGMAGGMGGGMGGAPQSKNPFASQRRGMF